MITLRTATRADIPLLADVIASVQAQTDSSIDVDKFQQVMVESINGYFGQDEPESVLSIIEVDGVPMGRLRVVRFENRIFLGGIQILPNYQGSGIGTHLIKELVAESRAVGKPLYLNVERDNAGARRLYDRLGLTRRGGTGKDIQLAFDPE